MTQGIETINSHTYFVVRDDAGNIVRQEARDPIRLVRNVATEAALAIDPAKATLADAFAALQLILKKLG